MSQNKFFITKTIRHKYIVKVRPFSLPKVRYMYDHNKPTIRDVKLQNITFHVKTYDLNFKKESSQVTKPIIDPTVFLKTRANIITISLITLLSNDLNNKANKVNNSLFNMCNKRHVPVIGHGRTIHRNVHLKKSALHLNKCGTKVFAKNVSSYLLEVN